MKAQYIKQVSKELHLSRKVKREILRDLDEMFVSAGEHGEDEQQVIARLGTPKEFADSTAAQFGVDLTAQRRRRGLLSGLLALAVAAAAFLVYAGIELGQAPRGAIGQSNAMTNIQVVGSVTLDVSAIAAAVGVAAALTAVVLIVRSIPHTGGKS